MTTPLPVSNSKSLFNCASPSTAHAIDNTTHNFQQLLRSSLLAPVISSPSDSDSSDSAAGLTGLMGSGSFGSGLMAMSMLLMLDTFFTLQTQSAYQSDDASSPDASSALSNLPGNGTAAHSSSSLISGGHVEHINQFDAAIADGRDGANSDCGPTSLVMALHQLGLRISGESGGNSAGELINLARKSMTNDASRDGVDASGNYVDWEHNSYTYFPDLEHGAAAAGAKSTRISATADSIAGALKSGRVVVASGTFAGKSPLPWTGDRGSDNSTAPGYATAHVIEISAYDSATRQFTVQDPARRTPIQVSASQLEAFLSGNAGALAIG
jgi:hypothetical protein